MVRNLMMITGLTLAVAAFGCSSDSSSNNGGAGGDGGSAGEDGAGGTAGEGGAGGAPGALDNCLDADDLTAVCDDGFQDDYVRTCATTALGQGPATSTCLQEDPPGLSMACADCFGDVTQCIFDNCIGDCAVDADSPACLACRDANGCDSALDNCTGDLSVACAE